MSSKESARHGGAGTASLHLPFPPRHFLGAREPAEILRPCSGGLNTGGLRAALLPGPLSSGRENVAHDIYGRPQCSSHVGSLV